ncbi:hypothetical protein T05_2501 [Trichinella murrelli]|uniref:Uncharacterized protein n=1 Tax=Trichinella murrelli TaxID=144512 RepID=A0A0V0T7V2_9BILA|nr:hypothetical protein T05_2501 [Trichinella murrelli]
MNWSTKLKDRKMNLRRPCKKLSVVCSLRSSKCTALVVMHVNMQMLALCTWVSLLFTSGRTNSEPAKSTPVWLNGSDSVTRSAGKLPIRSR